MKTKEERNAIKEEMETVNSKLRELTDEELKQVAGGKESGSGQTPQGKPTTFDTSFEDSK